MIKLKGARHLGNLAILDVTRSRKVTFQSERFPLIEESERPNGIATEEATDSLNVRMSTASSAPFDEIRTVLKEYFVNVPSFIGIDAGPQTKMVIVSLQWLDAVWRLIVGRAIDSDGPCATSTRSTS